MILKNCKIFDGIKFFDDLLDLEIKDNLIVKIGKDLDIGNKKALDLKGQILTPGFIDIHSHGIGGYDFSYINDKEDLDKIFDLYVSKGTTSLVPTSVTMPLEDINKLLEIFIDYEHPAFSGFHLEGPFINQEKTGAHIIDYILPPKISHFKEIEPKYYSLIKRVTIACELDEDFALAKFLNNLGILVSFGHTTCDAHSAIDAFNNGYLLSTHHFNAMPQLHHREVSITGAALLHDEVSCEYIPDLYHIEENMLKILFKLKKPSALIMVTDSIAASGMKDGKYKLGQMTVSVKDGLVTNEKGTIAGSSITMMQGVYNMIEKGFDQERVLRSATSNPALYMKIEKKGFIKENYYADLNILSKKFQYLGGLFQGKTYNIEF